MSTMEKVGKNVDARSFKFERIHFGYATFIYKKTREICSKAAILGLFKFTKNKTEMWFRTSTKFVSREVQDLRASNQALIDTLVTINSFVQASGTTV
jgi:hypothetical protein